MNTVKKSKTTNKYWIFLENLRRSGVINMYCASIYLERIFYLSSDEADKILLEWMAKYNPDDYE